MSEPSTGIRYAKNDRQFHREVARRVDNYFEQNGISRKANSKMHAYGAVVLTVIGATYAMIVSGQIGGWSLYGLQLVNGVATLLGTLAIAHDASHNAYSEKGWVNRWLARFFDIAGTSSYVWEFNHKRSHHAGPNVPLFDAAIDSMPLFRLHPKAEWRPFMKYQHWYMPVIYSFATLFKWFYLDFFTLTRNRVGGVEVDEHDTQDLLELFGFKILLYSYGIVIPLMVVPVPWYQYMAGFFSYHFINGMIIAFVFQVTHLADRTEFIEPDEDGQLPDTFAVHTLKTTADFAPDSVVARWFTGGLNLHIAHHLFPDICQVHLPAVTRIVRQTAEEYDLPYRAYPTTWAAFRSHQRLLKCLGQTEQLSPDAEGRIRMGEYIGPAPEAAVGQ